MTSLPADMFRFLSNLEYVDLRNNRLRELPATIGFVFHSIKLCELEELEFLQRPHAAENAAFARKLTSCAAGRAGQDPDPHHAVARRKPSRLS